MLMLDDDSDNEAFTWRQLIQVIETTDKYQIKYIELNIWKEYTKTKLKKMQKKSENEETKNFLCATFFIYNKFLI